VREVLLLKCPDWLGERNVGHKEHQMKLLMLVILILMTLLSGCARYLRPVKGLPEAENSRNNITILRNYNYIGAAMRYWPTVDGQEVSGLFPKQYISFMASPGKHRVGVRCLWSEDQLETDITDNEIRFFKISLDLWSLIGIGCAEIEEIPKTEAIERLETSTRIKTGFMSDCDRKSVKYDSKPDYTCFSYALP
jgi:hypothetical protein